MITDTQIKVIPETKEEKEAKQFFRDHLDWMKTFLLSPEAKEYRANFIQHLQTLHPSFTP